MPGSIGRVRAMSYRERDAMRPTSPDSTPASSSGPLFGVVVHAPGPVGQRAPHLERRASAAVRIDELEAARARFGDHHIFCVQGVATSRSLISAPADRHATTKPRWSAACAPCGWCYATPPYPRPLGSARALSFRPARSRPACPCGSLPRTCTSWAVHAAPVRGAPGRSWGSVNDTPAAHRTPAPLRACWCPAFRPTAPASA